MLRSFFCNSLAPVFDEGISICRRPCNFFYFLFNINAQNTGAQKVKLRIFQCWAKNNSLTKSL